MDRTLCIVALMLLTCVMISCDSDVENPTANTATSPLSEGIMAAPANQHLLSEIEAANDNFEQAFGNDAAGLAALYTEEGKVLPTNSDFIAGRPAIQAFWQSVFDAGITQAQLNIVELEGLGNTANEVGTYILSDGITTLDQGKYVVIWKRVNGDWKLHRDIFNSSLPAP